MGRKKIYENANERNKAHRQRKKTELESLKAAKVKTLDLEKENYEWSFQDGAITGICCVASDFAGKNRVPTARRILAQYQISRNDAASALGAAGRITLACLDMAKVWPLSDDDYEKIYSANLLILK